MGLLAAQRRAAGGLRRDRAAHRAARCSTSRLFRMPGLHRRADRGLRAARVDVLDVPLPRRSTCRTSSATRRSRRACASCRSRCCRSSSRRWPGKLAERLPVRGFLGGGLIAGRHRPAADGRDRARRRLDDAAARLHRRRASASACVNPPLATAAIGVVEPRRSGAAVGHQQHLPAGRHRHRHRRRSARSSRRASRRSSATRWRGAAAARRRGPARRGGRRRGHPGGGAGRAARRARRRGPSRRARVHSTSLNSRRSLIVAALAVVAFRGFAQAVAASVARLATSSTGSRDLHRGRDGRLRGCIMRPCRSQIGPAFVRRCLAEPAADRAQKGMFWHIASPSSRATAPGPSSRRRPGACSRPPASSSTGTSRTPASTSTSRRATRCPTARSTRSASAASRIKGPTTTPVGSGHRSINVALRKEFDLYACIRPCKAYEGVRTRFPETDIVIVRENTEDLYAGIEFEKGSEEVGEAARLPRRRARLADPRGRRASRSSRSPCSARSGSSSRPSSTREENGREQGHRRAQGQHHEVLRRPVPRGRAPGGRAPSRTSSSRTGSSTTSATSSCRGPRSTT